MSSSWLRWAFAAAMVGVALFHTGRLVAARPHRVPVDAELTHAAMGVVMTLMLIGALGTSGSHRLALVFAAALVWFTGRAVHSYVMDGPRAVGAPIRHVIGCAAMSYMLVAVTGASTAASAAMPGMSVATTSTSSSLVPAVLLVATLGVALWTVTRPRTVGLPATPALAAGCQLAMSAATIYMLMAI